MNEISLIDEFVPWLRRLGSIPAAWKAARCQPNLPDGEARKRAENFIKMTGIENQVNDILQNFQEQSIQKPLTKDECALVLAQIIRNPGAKDSTRLQAISELTKLESWQVQKQQSINANVSAQEILNRKLMS